MEEWKGRPAAEIAQAPPVLAEIQKAVARVNKQLAPFEQVRKYRVLGARFLHRAGRTDGDDEGAAHAGDGELQRAHRRAVRGAGVDPRTAQPALQFEFGADHFVVQASASG